MKTITNKNEIEYILEAASLDNAYPTSRLLPGAWEQENCQEWAAYGDYTGTPVKVYWVFENAGCESEDAGDYPWEDLEKIAKIEVAEKNEDGDYDEL